MADYLDRLKGGPDSWRNGDWPGSVSAPELEAVLRRAIELSKMADPYLLSLAEPPEDSSTEGDIPDVT